MDVTSRESDSSRHQVCSRGSHTGHTDSESVRCDDERWIRVVVMLLATVFYIVKMSFQLEWKKQIGYRCTAGDAYG